MAGESVRLLLHPPDTLQGWRVTPYFATRVREGLTLRENRQAAWGHVRLRQEVALRHRSGDELAAFREALTARTDELWAMPVWADARRATERDDALFAGAWWLCWEDRGAWPFSVHAADSLPDPAPYPLLAPLLFGRLKEDPEGLLRWNADGTERTRADCYVTLQEESPLAMAAGIHTVPVGESWPEALVPNEVEPIRETIQHDPIRHASDERREVLLEDADRGVRFTQTALYSLRTRDHIRTLLSFFAARQGRLESFTMPLYSQARASDSIVVPPSARMRFGRDALELTFRTFEKARATLEFVEAPHDGAAAGEGENPELPRKTLLLEITHDLPVPTVWRFTTGDDVVTALGATWTPAPIKEVAVDRIVSDVSTATFTVDDFRTGEDPRTPAGNPLAMFALDALSGELWITIREYIHGTGTVITRFAGVIDTPEDQGATHRYTARDILHHLERDAPEAALQSSCNNQWGDFGCKLDRDAWRRPVTITGIEAEALSDGSTTVVTSANFGTLDLTQYTWTRRVHLALGTAPAKVVSSGAWSMGDLVPDVPAPLYFAWQLASYEPGAGDTAVAVLEDNLLEPADLLDATGHLYPGCTGQPSMCADDYDNFVNFFGGPFQQRASIKSSVTHELSAVRGGISSRISGVAGAASGNAQDLRGLQETLDELVRRNSG